MPALATDPDVDLEEDVPRSSTGAGPSGREPQPATSSAAAVSAAHRRANEIEERIFSCLLNLSFGLEPMTLEPMTLEPMTLNL